MPIGVHSKLPLINEESGSPHERFYGAPPAEAVVQPSEKPKSAAVKDAWLELHQQLEQVRAQNGSMREVMAVYDTAFQKIFPEIPNPSLVDLKRLIQAQVSPEALTAFQELYPGVNQVELQHVFQSFLDLIQKDAHKLIEEFLLPSSDGSWPNLVRKLVEKQILTTADLDGLDDAAKQQKVLEKIPLQTIITYWEGSNKPPSNGQTSLSLAFADKLMLEERKKELYAFTGSLYETINQDIDALMDNLEFDQFLDMFFCTHTSYGSGSRFRSTGTGESPEFAKKQEATNNWLEAVAGDEEAFSLFTAQLENPENDKPSEKFPSKENLEILLEKLKEYEQGGPDEDVISNILKDVGKVARLPQIEPTQLIFSRQTREYIEKVYRYYLVNSPQRR